MGIGSCHEIPVEPFGTRIFQDEGFNGGFKDSRDAKTDSTNGFRGEKSTVDFFRNPAIAK